MKDTTLSKMRSKFHEQLLRISLDMYCQSVRKVSSKNLSDKDVCQSGVPGRAMYTQDVFAPCFACVRGARDERERALMTTKNELAANTYYARNEKVMCALCPADKWQHNGPASC